MACAVCAARGHFKQNHHLPAPSSRKAARDLPLKLIGWNFFHLPIMVTFSSITRDLCRAHKQTNPLRKVRNEMALAEDPLCLSILCHFKQTRGENVMQRQTSAEDRCQAHEWQRWKILNFVTSQATASTLRKISLKTLKMWPRLATLPD